MFDLIVSAFYDICVLVAISLASMAAFNAIFAVISGFIGLLLAMLAALGAGLCTAYSIEFAEQGFDSVKTRVLRLMDQGWMLVKGAVPEQAKPTLVVVPS